MIRCISKTCRGSWPERDLIKSLSYTPHSKIQKKTDRFDAHALADLLRGGYIHASYVSPPKTVEEKRAICFRTGMVQNRTKMKNMIHGILLQESIKIPGRTFTPAFNRALHGLKDWRIDECLKGIGSLDERISRADFRINDMVKDTNTRKFSCRYQVWAGSQRLPSHQR